MKNIPLCIMFAVILCFQCCGVKSNTNAINSYVSDFLRNDPARLDKALALLPTIRDLSNENGIDPLLTVLVITWESSWYTTALGGDNEIGLMQVIPGGVCAKGQDLSTPEGQIKAGVECLALSRDSCNGTLKQTLTMYASGKCKSKSKRTQRKIRWRVWQYERDKIL